MISLVVITPDPMHEAFQAVAVDGFSYTVGTGIPLSPTGQEPATPRGIHDYATPARAAVMMGEADPAPTEAYTSAEIAGAISQCIVTEWGLTATEKAAEDPENPSPRLKNKAHFNARNNTVLTCSETVRGSNNHKSSASAMYD